MAICIVFVPVLLLTGAARYLFTPLALAVVFAMAASYILSRTLVPTMMHAMLGSEVEMYAHGEHGEGAAPNSFFGKIHWHFNHRFERLRSNYEGLLSWCLDHRRHRSRCFRDICDRIVCDAADYRRGLLP